MTDLFNIPESKSPRLLWMEKHGIKTVHYDSRYLNRWEAKTKTHNAFGETELLAIGNLSKLLQIKLWNEE